MISYMLNIAFDEKQNKTKNQISNLEWPLKISHVFNWVAGSPHGCLSTQRINDSTSSDGQKEVRWLQKFSMKFSQTYCFFFSAWGITSLI